MALKRRPRRYWPHWVVVALPIVGFRYDETRHAYVLRRIGNERGPVIRDVRVRGRLVRERRTRDDDGSMVAVAAAHAEAGDDAPSTATVITEDDEARSHRGSASGPPLEPLTAERPSDPRGGGNSR